MRCETDEQSTELENGSLSVKVHDTCKKLVVFWYGFKSILSVLKPQCVFPHPSPHHILTRARAVNSDGEFVRYFYQSISPHCSSPSGKPTPDNENGAWPRLPERNTCLWMIYRMTGMSHLQRITYYVQDDHVSKPFPAPALNLQQSSALLHSFPKIGIVWHKEVVWFKKQW